MERGLFQRFQDWETFIFMVLGEKRLGNVYFHGFKREKGRKKNECKHKRNVKEMQS